jgi:hypothetical protein
MNPIASSAGNTKVKAIAFILFLCLFTLQNCVLIASGHKKSNLLSQITFVLVGMTGFDLSLRIPYECWVLRVLAFFTHKYLT